MLASTLFQAAAEQAGTLNVLDLGTKVITLLAAIVAAVVGVLNYMQKNKELEQKAHDEERKEIYKKLNSFYGPLQHLLNTSQNLYELFRARQPQGFRTLTELLNGEEFLGNDKVLLDEILTR